MNTDIASLRQEYAMASLDENDVSKNPLDQFGKWFDESISSQLIEPNAMILSTVNSDGEPCQRTVLMKDFDESGFTFFSNYASVKGQQIEQKPTVSLLFPWYPLERQVIIQGTATKVSREASREYFHSRPKGSQIGSFVSNQSEEIPSRVFLEKKLEAAKQEFKNKEVPLKEDWGGYLIKPYFFEFWQGRESRLHDRICFNLQGNDWKITRKSP